MASKKDDPTVTSDIGGPAYPEGTHPARPVSEVTTSAANVKYRENPDKPDSTSIAQLADVSALTGNPDDK